MINSRSMLITAGHDDTIRFWDNINQRQIETIVVKESQTNCLSVSPNGIHLAAGGYQALRLFDCTHPVQPLHVFNVHDRNVTTLGFNCDGTWIFTGGEDFKAKVWDLRSNSIICQRIFQLGSAVNSVVLHPNQRQLLVADSTGGIYIWDIRTNHDDSLWTELNYTEFVVDLDFDRTGKQVAAITNKGSCFLYSNFRDSSAFDSIIQHQQPQQQHLLDDEVDNNTFGPSPSPVHLQSDNQGRPSLKFKPHQQYGLKCKFSYEGDVLATTGGDDVPKIWSITEKDGKPEIDLKLRIEDNDYRDSNNRITSKWIWGLSFAESSNLIYAGGSDGICRGFKLNDRTCYRRFTGHTKGISALTFYNPNMYR